MTASLYVALAIVIFVVLLWKPVGSRLIATLDKRADKIAADLEEAAKLRREAEALLAEYRQKSADMQREADDILRHAERQASQLTDKAEQELKATLARREAQAIEKITQAEQAAIAEVRALAVDVALAASRDLLAKKIDAGANDKLLQQALQKSA